MHQMVIVLQRVEGPLPTDVNSDGKSPVASDAAKPNTIAGINHQFIIHIVWNEENKLMETILA